MTLHVPQSFFTTTIATPLGDMVAISDKEYLYILEFLDRKNLLNRINDFKKRYNALLVTGTSAPLQSITLELQSYFAGTLKTFTTPCHLHGTDFQNNVWSHLATITYGTTLSYSKQAHALGRPTACRAVAHANSLNWLAIIIPCHRIIKQTGALGGYAGGLDKKHWLIEHEKNIATHK